MVWDKLDKIWATFLAIVAGVGMVEYLFNYEEKPWSWVGPAIWFIAFLHMLYQIKHQRTVWPVLLGAVRRRWKKRGDGGKTWNQRVADGDI